LAGVPWLIRVKVHLKNIFSRLGVADRTEAVTLALSRGILHLD
jgi:DNA-binding NarL/FixJ family response regulator